MHFRGCRFHPSSESHTWRLRSPVANLGSRLSWMGDPSSSGLRVMGQLFHSICTALSVLQLFSQWVLTLLCSRHNKQRVAAALGCPGAQPEGGGILQLGPGLCCTAPPPPPQPPKDPLPLPSTPTRIPPQLSTPILFLFPLGPPLPSSLPPLSHLAYPALPWAQPGPRLSLLSPHPVYLPQPTLKPVSLHQPGQLHPR